MSISLAAASIAHDFAGTETNEVCWAGRSGAIAAQRASDARRIDLFRVEIRHLSRIGERALER